MGQDPGHAAVDDRLTIAQEAVWQIRSREVITKALRVMKDHPIITEQADPEDFVARQLDVEVMPPGVIFVRLSLEEDPTSAPTWSMRLSMDSCRRQRTNRVLSRKMKSRDSNSMWQN